jgi:hypothetical protein
LSRARLFFAIALSAKIPMYHAVFHPLPPITEKYEESKRIDDCGNTVCYTVTDFWLNHPASPGKSMRN